MNADLSSAVAEIAAELARGGVVGVPTDTVYGLAGLVASPAALGRIFELKGRPADFALPVLVGDLDQAVGITGPNARLGALAAAFWPGPLTVVVRPDGRPPAALGGDGETVGVRCPADHTVRALCRAVGALAVTSANRHGEPPATTAAEVTVAFGSALAVVLDGGPRNRPPSTVVSIAEETALLLRAGSIPLEDVQSVLSAAEE